MRLFEVGSIVFIVVVLIAAGYALVKKVKPNICKDDNKVEEFVEGYLEKELGVEKGKLDLTSDSKET